MDSDCSAETTSAPGQDGVMPPTATVPERSVSICGATESAKLSNGCYSNVELDRTTGEVIKVCSDFDPRLQFLLAFSVTPVFENEERKKEESKPVEDVTEKVGCSRRRVDVEEGKELPDEVLERIIAKVPFPALFKARSLSRTWYFKFPLPSQRARSVDSDFQNHVNAVSGQWTSYCPILFTWLKDIVGFDRTLSRWRSVSSFSYLDVLNWSDISCAGALICMISETVSELGTKVYNLVVSNLLTRSFRKLRVFYSKPVLVRLVLAGSHAYKVFVVVNDEDRALYDFPSDDEDLDDGVSVYDSQHRTWTKRNFGLNEQINYIYFYENAAFLDGRFYGMDGEPDLAARLWCYQVDSNRWTRVADRFDLSCRKGGVVCCGKRVFVCLCDSSALVSQRIATNSLRTTVIYTCQSSIRIFELDLKSLRLNKVSTGPPEVVVRSCGTRKCGLYLHPIHISSDLNFIYFSRDSPQSAVVLTLDVRNLEWGSLPTAGSASTASSGDPHYMIRGASCFEPGRNPFVMV